MMANRVAVEFAVDESGKGRAAIQEADDQVKKIGQSGAARDIWDDLIKGAGQAKDKIGDLDDAIEDSFVKSKASAASAGESFVRSVTSAQRQALALQSSTRSLGADGQRISAQAGTLQEKFALLYRQLSTGRPLSQLTADLEKNKIQLEQLNSRAISLRSRSISAAAAAGPADGGRIPGLSTAVGFAGSQLGIPGLGTITSSLGAGGLAAGLGIGVAAFAGIRELITLSSQAEQSQLDLALAARDTGHSFGEAAVTAEQFHQQMVANSAEANKLAGAFQELQLRSGGVIGLGSTQAVANLANARGLDPEKAAAALLGIAKGSKAAFQELTGLDADLALDRYAKAAHRTVSELTDVERVQALWNGVQQRSVELADLGAARMATLDSRWQSFKNTLGEVGEKIGHISQASGDQIAYLATLGQFGAGPGETYRREVAQYDAQAAADNRRIMAENRAKKEVAERNAQQAAARDAESFFSDFERDRKATRPLPALITAGLDPAERQEQLRARHQAELEQIRQERTQLELARQKFEREDRGKLSSDDQKKFGQRFDEALLENADRSRAISDQMAKEAAEAAEQIAQLVRAARDQVKGFLAESAVAAERDNPFAAIFINGRLEVEKTRESFRIFGDDFANEMARIKQQSIDGELALVRFTSQITALKNLQEARRLDEGIIGASGPEERRLAVLDAQIKNISHQADLSRQINFLENPFRRYGAFEQGRDFAAQLRELQKLDTSGAGRGGARAQAAAILELTGGIDARTLATSGDPSIRAARAARLQALKTEREQSALDVRDAIGRERAGNQLQGDARELLKVVQGSGLTDSRKLKEFLAITGALSDKELTGDLRLGRAAALRESARQEGKQEERARAQEKLLFGDEKNPGLIGKLNNLISQKGIKVDAGPAATVNISSKDVATTRQQLGPAMTKDESPPVPGYAPGFR